LLAPSGIGRNYLPAIEKVSKDLQTASSAASDFGSEHFGEQVFTF